MLARVCPLLGQLLALRPQHCPPRGRCARLTTVESLSLRSLESVLSWASSLTRSPSVASVGSLWSLESVPSWTSYSPCSSSVALRGVAVLARVLSLCGPVTSPQPALPSVGSLCSLETLSLELLESVLS